MGEGLEVHDIDMHSHLEALVACGTRLTAMKQVCKFIKGSLAI